MRASVTPKTALIGIHTGGVWLAQRLHTELALKQPLGTIDVSFYRDDFDSRGLHPKVRPSEIPFEVADVDIILVDDVLHTGRTIRAAMNELFDYGRPRSIRLAALIDRATREFGGLDMVFNVAGPWLNGDPLAHWSRIVSANLLGTMQVTRQAIDVLKRRGGAIVNVAADAGLGFGAEDRPAYCAAKAGIVRLTTTLGSLKDQKIRVNCIAPDVIEEVDDFAAATIALALREDCAGRVVLYRAGRAAELVEFGDPGFRQTQPL